MGIVLSVSFVRTVTVKGVVDTLTSENVISGVVSFNIVRSMYCK